MIIIPIFNNLAISKKSKFASRVNEFKSDLLSEKDYSLILKTNYTSSDQHNWGGAEEAKKEVVSVNARETIKACGSQYFCMWIHLKI